MSQGKRKGTETRAHKIFSVVIRFVPLLSVIAVIAAFYMIFDMKTKIENNDYDTSDIIVDENTVTNTNAVIQNSTVNNTVNNVVDNSIVNNTVENTTTSEQPTESTEQLSPEEVEFETAKKIFIDFWGADADTIVEITKNDSGEFIAKATSKSTGDNRFFKIDVSNNRVTEY